MVLKASYGRASPSAVLQWFFMVADIFAAGVLFIGMLNQIMSDQVEVLARRRGNDYPLVSVTQEGKHGGRTNDVEVDRTRVRTRLNGDQVVVEVKQPGTQTAWSTPP